MNSYIYIVPVYHLGIVRIPPIWFTTTWLFGDYFDMESFHSTFSISSLWDSNKKTRREILSKLVACKNSTFNRGKGPCTTAKPLCLPKFLFSFQEVDGTACICSP